MWGSASQYPCIECGGQAKDWAYDGTDPVELLEIARQGTAMFYSRYPEFYMPMCRKCHGKRDGAMAQGELREYREWRYRTGLTVQALPAEYQGDTEKVPRLAGATGGGDGNDH
ncbi:hypothetical protein [Mycobacterium phage WXIN]|nr:hypothetical protein [Mycobacterium phage WXIN]